MLPGYIRIDLEDEDLSVGRVIPGIYELISSNSDKPVLLTGLTAWGVKLNDAWANFSYISSSTVFGNNVYVSHLFKELYDGGQDDLYIKIYTNDRVIGDAIY